MSHPKLKVAVNGTITTMAVVVTAAGWPDYVFDQDHHAARLIAESRAGSVLREFPGQYLNATLTEIKKDAKAGIQAARKALKRLTDNREKFK